MQLFAIANATSSATQEVRARLVTLGLEETDAIEDADVVILAVGELEGQLWAKTTHGLRDRVNHGVVAVMSARCARSDWFELLGTVPALVSASATSSELLARLHDARDARKRLELSAAGERRLALLRQSLEEVSMIDMRTGMYNRRFLITRLREALSAARRYDRPLTLCVFRVEDYDALVDAQGDEVATQMVDALCDQLAASLRSADIQAWIHKDEFALLLPETPGEGAQRVLDRVAEQARAIGEERGIPFAVLGVYASPGKDDTNADAFVDDTRSKLPATDAAGD